VNETWVHGIATNFTAVLVSLNSSWATVFITRQNVVKSSPSWFTLQQAGEPALSSTVLLAIYIACAVGGALLLGTFAAVVWRYKRLKKEGKVAPSPNPQLPQQHLPIAPEISTPAPFAANQASYLLSNIHIYILSLSWTKKA
jgi:hypothetical protein